MNKKENTSFAKSKKAFNKFIKKYGDNKDFQGMAVGFHNGELVAIMTYRSDIVKYIFSEFGNVPCYVGEITNDKRELLIEEATHERQNLREVKDE